jgi:CRISPR-associated protein Cas5d
MKKYEIALEIAGATAMWTRPDTGDCPVSYPIPTYSAAKGIFESIIRFETVDIVPSIVEICSPIVYHNYVTNYGGPLRKSAIMPNGSYQLLATVLINVCYRLYAEIKPTKHKPLLSEKALQQKNKGFNDRHACQEIFNRRLKQGQCHDVPFLGWREFALDYYGPFRDTTKVEGSVNLTLPSLLHSVFEPSGYKNPKYKQDKKIENGGLVYA